MNFYKPEPNEKAKIAAKHKITLRKGLPMMLQRNRNDISLSDLDLKLFIYEEYSS